jgi:RHS repeat-associated protein
VGNRLSETVGQLTPTNYAYTPHTNRLAKQTGAVTQSFAYTGSGNIASATPASGSAAVFSYNQANRLSASAVPSAAPQEYAYDWRGLLGTRTVTSTSPVTPYQYQYDLGGHLLEEQDQGVAQVDYIWLAGQPLATVTPSTGIVTYLVTDRLQQPRLGVQPTGEATAGTVTWVNAALPFGGQSVSGSLQQNLRLPGQVADPDTGWYHNGMRDYMPTWGRYLQTDPIGLAGGMNTYGYVAQNPLKFVDPSGELFFDDPNVWWILVQIHYGRNTFNESVSYQDAQTSWIALTPVQSIFHTQGVGNEGNQKFISPNGGNSEAVFTSCGEPVTDSLNGPSYNFADPLNDPVLHAILDVAPYLVLGNDQTDLSNPQRFETVWNKIVIPYFQRGLP